MLPAPRRRRSRGTGRQPRWKADCSPSMSGFAACRKPRSPDKLGRQGDNPMAATIRIALVSRTIFYAPVWVAEQNGYFHDEGIDARFDIFDNAEKINEVMRAGTAQIAIASVEALVADAFKGGTFRIVASVAQKPPHFIITQPRFKTVMDLRGARFGVCRCTKARRISCRTSKRRSA